MAPAASPVLASNTSSDHLRSFHRRIRSFSRHTLAQLSLVRREFIQSHTPDATLQSSLVPDAPSSQPPPFPTDTAPPPPVFSEQPGPTLTDTPYTYSQSRSTNHPGDVPGNIVAAVAVAVLILGGLIGLILGGTVLRRWGKTAEEERRGLGCFTRKKSKVTRRTSKNSTNSSPECVQASPEKLSYDEQTSPPLTRPSAVVSREGRGRLSGVWPLRSLSQALHSHRRVATRKASAPSRQQISPPVASPQTTWSEFTPATLYVPSSRTILPGIPEEREEDRRSQTPDSDFAIMLGVTLQRYSDPVLSSPHNIRSGSTSSMTEDESTETGMQRASEERRIACNDNATNEETKSLESSAPDMTSDGEESNRSSMASLDESFSEEAFELRRAQTTSMQMNKGVLISLGMKTVEHARGVGPRHGERECASSRVPTYESLEEVRTELAESGLTMEMLGGSFNAIDLDDFPSPPSILPKIPSFVSSF